MSFQPFKQYAPQRCRVELMADDHAVTSRHATSAHALCMRRRRAMSCDWAACAETHHATAVFARSMKLAASGSPCNRIEARVGHPLRAAMYSATSPLEEPSRPCPPSRTEPPADSTYFNVKVHTCCSYRCSYNEGLASSESTARSRIGDHWSRKNHVAVSNEIDTQRKGRTCDANRKSWHCRAAVEFFI